jgi:hypothetical protein
MAVAAMAPFAVIVFRSSRAPAAIGRLAPASAAISPAAVTF